MVAFEGLSMREGKNETEWLMADEAFLAGMKACWY
jgi:hypothetical protein